MDRKIRSKAGQAIYALRKTIVEPVFGQIKGARGLDGLLLRGLEKVDAEWTMMAITCPATMKLAGRRQARWPVG